MRSALTRSTATKKSKWGSVHSFSSSLEAGSLGAVWSLAPRVEWTLSRPWAHIRPQHRCRQAGQPGPESAAGRGRGKGSGQAPEEGHPPSLLRQILHPGPSEPSEDLRKAVGRSLKHSPPRGPWTLAPEPQRPGRIRARNSGPRGEKAPAALQGLRRAQAQSKH